MNVLDIKKKSTFIYRGVCNTILLNTVYTRQYDLRQTLVIAGSTRSGSTWLAEIVSAHPQAGQIFEPISPTNVREAQKIGFTHNIFLEPDAEWPAGKAYLEKVFRGKVLTPWTTSQIPIAKTKKIRFLVVKFVRANLFLGWLTKNFLVKPPALIIRHPCATIVSQMQKEWIPGKKILLSNPFFSSAPQLKKDCEKFNRPEELLAIKWCMQYHAPLSLSAPYPFHLMTYEGLVRNGEKEISELFSSWKVPLTQESVDRLILPSKTVTSNSQIVKGRDTLSGWKSSLSSEQISRINSIVRLFNLDFYTTDLEPNWELLRNFTSGFKSLPPLS